MMEFLPKEIRDTDSEYTAMLNKFTEMEQYITPEAAKEFYLHKVKCFNEILENRKKRLLLLNQELKKAASNNELSILEIEYEIRRTEADIKAKEVFLKTYKNHVERTIKN